jgi:hypothetical protein
MVGGEEVESTASFVAWIGKKHGSNLLLDTLYDEGCVPTARSSQPQAIMHLETTSNVYGRTVNPYNRNLTPGGSTGGESALIGMRGSILVSVFPLRTSFTMLTNARASAETSVVAFAARLLMSESMGSSE